MTDFLLINPPVSNFGQVPAALPVLTAWLRSRGWNAQQWDLGIEAFHHLYSSENIAQVRQKLVQQHADDELLQVACSVQAALNGAKKALQTPMITTDEQAMARALATIADAGVVMTASSDVWEISDNKFSVHGAMNSFESLAYACTSPECNPFAAYFESVVLDRIAAMRPKTVGISISYFSQVIPGLALATLIRKRFEPMPIVLGGSYLTATHHELSRAPVSAIVADAVIVRDGEHALDQWLRHVLYNEPMSPLSNVYLRDANHYRKAGDRQSGAMDLDHLPVPMITCDGLDLGQYLTPSYAHGIPLTRGCYWGRCHYCNISNQTSCSYRKRSVELAIRDIRAVVEQTGANWFDFPVDSFHPRDLWQLSKALIQQHIDIRWGAEVLLDGGFRDEVIADLARSGCVCLRFGMESGSATTLRAMNKATRPKLAQRILESCRCHGIRTAAMFIVGFPTETYSQLQQTFDFVVDNQDRIDFLTFHDYSLVIGSPMANDPGAFGLYLQAERAVMASNLPFINTNPGGMQSGQTLQAISALRDSLKPYYPNLGKLWATGIGGWLTFAYCCENRKTSFAGNSRVENTSQREPARASAS